MVPTDLFYIENIPAGGHNKAARPERQATGKLISGGKRISTWLPAKGLETFQVAFDFVFAVKSVVVTGAQVMERHIVF